MTPAPLVPTIGSDETSQTLCLASNATEGSLTRSKGPLRTTGDDTLVMPGRKPCVQVAPPSVDVAKPMSLAPPSVNRPDWKTETIVLPFDSVSGSTWVAC